MSSWENTFEESNHQSSRQQLIINQLLREQERRTEAFSRPLEYFYEDITGEKLRVSLISILPKGVYQDAREHIEACLISCSVQFRKMHPKQLGNCIQSLVHASNLIFKFYIESKLDEPMIASPYKNIKFGQDRVCFYHLELRHSKINYRYNMGAGMNALYDMLNDTKHILKKEDGKVKVVRLKYKQLISPAANSTSRALKGMEQAFYKEFEASRL